MKNFNEDIDKVLAGLRDCKVPDGMEARILRRMQDRATMQAAPGRRAWMAGRTFTFAAAVLLVCVVGLAGFLSMSRLDRLSGKPQIQSSRTMPVLMASEGNSAAVRARVDIPARFKERIFVPGARSMSHAGFSRHTVKIVSYPAPPLPLTEQEKLLLHVAHHANARDLLLLNAEQQALQLAKVNENFENFFGQVNAENADNKEKQ